MKISTFSIALTFCVLLLFNVSLDRGNGAFNSSNTDVVEKDNVFTATSQHRDTSAAEGST